MGAMARCAPHLLAHLNLLLLLYAGAALATAARLKWDPSTYVALRELLPDEYPVLAVGLCVWAVALLLLAHLCAVALCAARARARTRRTLLLTYAAGTALVAGGEVAWAAWLAGRGLHFLHSDRAKLIQEAAALVEQLKDLLDKFSSVADMRRLKLVIRLVQEAREDALSNVYVLAVGAGLLAVLQLLAIATALVAAAAAAAADDGARARPRISHRWGAGKEIAPSASLERLVAPRAGGVAPPRSPRPLTAYRNGRIVIL